MADDRDFWRAANVLLKLTKRGKNKSKILSQNNGVTAPVVKPPVVSGGISEGRQQVVPVGALDDSSRISENILEGDLTRLVERLHELEGQQLRQLVSDLRTAFSEIAPETDRRLPATSATSNESQCSAGELSKPSASVEESASAPTVECTLPDVVEPATKHRPIIKTPAPPSTHEKKPSEGAVGTRWAKRAGLSLTLMVIIASVPWSLPVMDLSLATKPNPAIVIRLDALEPSHGDQVSKQPIAPLGAARAPPAQLLSVLSDATTGDIVPVEVTTAPQIRAASAPITGPDIEALLDRGDQLLRRGDIIAARSFYERAATSGSARAATSVARTFDPAFLSQLGVVGIHGSPERAAAWYRKAEEATANPRSLRHDGE